MCRLSCFSQLSLEDSGMPFPGGGGFLGCGFSWWVCLPVGCVFSWLVGALKTEVAVWIEVIMAFSKRYT